MNHPPQKDMCVRERGIALVTVLWVVVLLSVLASALVAMTRADGRIAQGELARLQATEAAKAGIALALVALADPGQHWPTDGTSQAIKFEDAEIQVSISAESGKVDLNTADPALLTGLMMAVGASPGDAETLSAEIVAKRRPDDNGGPPHLFHSVGELVELPQMTLDLYARLTPDLTVYSGSSSIDANVATMDVLLAIPGNTRPDAEEALAARASPDQGIARNGDISRIMGHAFTVTGNVEKPSGTFGRYIEAVRLTADPKRPVWILRVE